MYTGLTGKLTIDNVPVAYVSNWSVDDTRELIEVSELGKKHKQKIAGQVSWTASADGTICFGTAGVTGHKALFDAMHSGSEVRCEFFLFDNGKVENAPASNAGVHSKPGVNVSFCGMGLIESLSIDLSAEDKGNISISISGVDELKYPGVTPRTPE